MIYKKAMTLSGIYVHDTYRISRVETGFRWEDKRGNWIDYDEGGRMTSYGSRSGISGAFLYNETGKCTGIADRNGTQVIWFEYEGDLLSAAYDATNRRVEYGYSGGKLDSVTDLLGYPTYYQYEAKARLTKVTDGAGRETRISYDQYGSVTSVLDSTGKGYRFEFDYDEARSESYARITFPGGMIKEIWYDREGETKRVDVNGRTVKKIVKDGRNLIITDDQGNQARQEYDEWDNLTRVFYPDGSDLSYEYERTFNKRTREVNERNITTRYAYDDSGNMIRKIEAWGTESERTTEYAYDEDGNQVTVKVLGDENTPESLTVMAYDEYGNMLSLTDPEENTTYFSHDIMGNVVTKTDARGKPWSYTYDAAGRLKMVTDPLTHTTSFAYDPAGNVRWVRDKEGKTTFYDYDALNRLKRVTDLLGNHTSYVYDDRDNLIALQDAKGNVTQFYYDRNNRLVRETRPLGQETAYAYDGAGNLVEKLDAKGQRTAYFYDDAGRLAEISYYDPADPIDPTKTVSFTYDRVGNLKTYDDAVTAGVYDYDALYRKVFETVDYGPFDLSYSYDYYKNGTKKAFTGPDDVTYSYTYDANNQLTGIQIPGTGMITYSDYRWNRPLMISDN